MPARPLLPGLAAAVALVGTLGTGCAERVVYVHDRREPTPMPAPAPAPVVVEDPAPVVVASAPAVVVQDDPPRYEDDAGITSPDQFVAPLSPYGTWIDRPGVGRVFVPSIAVVGTRYRPYTYGHWENTEWGWTWVDHHPFGWATGHYGGWLYDRAYGWVWAPGTTWAPAWVAWRDGGGYVGWAPLPPGASLRGGYRVYDTSWVFVSSSSFGVGFVGGVLVTGATYRHCHDVTVPNRSTVIVYDREIYRGPDDDDIRRHGGHVIHRPVRDIERDRPVTRPPRGVVIHDRDEDRRGGRGRRDDDRDDREHGRDRDDDRRDDREHGRDRDDDHGRSRSHDDNGHGNDRGGDDPSNPGRSDGAPGRRDDGANGHNGRGNDDGNNGRGNNGRGNDNANNGRGNDDGHNGRGNDDGHNGRGNDDGHSGRGNDDGHSGRGNDNANNGRGNDDANNGRDSGNRNGTAQSVSTDGGRPLVSGGRDGSRPSTRTSLRPIEPRRPDAMPVERPTATQLRDDRRLQRMPDVMPRASRTPVAVTTPTPMPAPVPSRAETPDDEQNASRSGTVPRRRNSSSSSSSSRNGRGR